jgi:hypothetical protein
MSVDYCMLHLTRRSRSPPPPLQSGLHFPQEPTEPKASDRVNVWILAWSCICCTNIYMTPAVAVYPDKRSPSSRVDVFVFQVPSRKNSLIVGQCIAAGLQPSAFHVCTWALLMQEDCLLYRGLDFSPSRPEMGWLADMWSWSLAV